MSNTSGFPAIRLAGGPGSDDPAAARKRMLKELAGRLDQHHGFAKGQFVVWRAGLKKQGPARLRRAGDRDRRLSEQIYDQTEDFSASPYFQEPLSLVIGDYHENDLVKFRVDGRRFEPLAGQAPLAPTRRFAPPSPAELGKGAAGVRDL